jgi:hypothetical protein
MIVSQNTINQYITNIQVQQLLTFAATKVQFTATATHFSYLFSHQKPSNYMIINSQKIYFMHFSATATHFGVSKTTQSPHNQSTLHLQQLLIFFKNQFHLLKSIKSPIQIHKINANHQLISTFAKPKKLYPKKNKEVLRVWIIISMLCISTIVKSQKTDEPQLCQSLSNFLGKDFKVDLLKNKALLLDWEKQKSDSLTNISVGCVKPVVIIPEFSLLISNHKKSKKKNITLSLIVADITNIVSLESTQKALEQYCEFGKVNFYFVTENFFIFTYSPQDHQELVKLTKSINLDRLTFSEKLGAIIEEHR